MVRLVLIGSVLLCLLSTVGCNRFISQTQQSEEHYIPVPNSVGFDIQWVPGSQGSTAWLANYTAKGKTAKFRIELEIPKPLEDKEAIRFDIHSGKGRFLAEPGSDASTLLGDLKTALEAKTSPTNSQRVGILPFSFVSFGSHQSQATGGGFNAEPPGNWTPMKIFVGEADQEGEFFLNLNPALKKGQFSIKDPDYGDIVLAHLAKVL